MKLKTFKITAATFIVIVCAMTVAAIMEVNWAIKDGHLTPETFGDFFGRIAAGFDAGRASEAR